MAQQAGALALLKNALDDLGTASGSARLQLHLLALEARQQSGKLGASIEGLEQRLDRSIHQALATATDKARQLSKMVQDSWRGHPPELGPNADRVGSIMTEPVEVCFPEETLSRAAQIMWEHDCGAVPVVDAEGKPCGMITDRDICMGTYTKGASPYSVRVADVMSPHVRSCLVDDPLRRAIPIMAEARVRRVPVLNAGGRVVGVLALADVVRAAPLLGEEAEALVFQLLGALSRRADGGAAQPSFAAE